MRVRMHTTLAHPDYAASAGATVNLPDEVAKDLITKGNASPLDDPEPKRRRPETVAHSSPPPIAEMAEGTVEAIITTVGESAEMATAVLEIEAAKPKPRKSLIAAMESVISDAMVPAAVAALDDQKD